MVSGYDKSSHSKSHGPSIGRNVGWAFVAGAAIATATILLIWTTAARAQDNCHPSYTPCVPIASDVDCAGGNGNGPVYVSGPIRVIGPDVYRLDDDGDGKACEPKAHRKRRG